MNCFINSSFSETFILGNDCKKISRKSQSSISMTTGSELSQYTKRRDILKFVATISSMSIFNSKTVIATKTASWERISLPVDTVLFDLDFVKDAPEHGWLVGSKGTFLETLDSGETWVPRTFANLDPDEELTYRFENVSFSGNDGWVIGKPAIMLHTKDGGKSWLRVPVSPKLPGEPTLITALGSDRAEMTTSSGAVYETTNGGRNWKAQVKETIDSTLNRTISSGVSGASYFTGSIIGVIRDTNGRYLAISSRGNFFLTWAPGQDFWIPRARETSRRIQAMGFIENSAEKGIWMSTRGGGLSFTTDVDLDSVNSFEFQNSDIKTGGYGILDVAYKNSNEMWAACGGGLLYNSLDGGKTWSKDNETGKIPGNLYKIKFFGTEQGFVLGSSGILLKYKS
jgi:photosystem II stability/assembly factor-like uncharacterized protein|mmetsp:Transcript_86106/g.125980  ORF Transcript_86106/g.125980 Transcript_86106/m.125980 type:complete len:398 (-) Transcript_86106:819-2012(-)